MKLTTIPACCLIGGLLAATNASADDYDFAIGAGFGRTSFDGSQTYTTSGGTIFNTSKIDTDNLSVVGNWYFAGLSDDKGPRAQAAFVDRASSLNVAYSRTDQTVATILTSNDPSYPFSLDSKVTSDGNSFSVDLHYVDRDNGWFGDAAWSMSNTSLSGIVEDSIDTTSWRLGIGKYLLETTTLGLDVSRVSLGSGGADATVATISFRHLADLGERWQYAVDVGYNHIDAGNSLAQNGWNTTIALYPNRDFEFGMSIQNSSGSDNGQDTTGVDGFASWYVRPNIRLSAHYGVDDVNFLGNLIIPGATRVSHADQNAFGISATVRF